MATGKAAAKKTSAKAAPRRTGANKRAAKAAAFDLEARLAARPTSEGERAPDMPAKALGKDAAELARVVAPYAATIRKDPEFDPALLVELAPRGEALLEAVLALGKARKAQARKSGGVEPVKVATELRGAILSGARYLFRKQPAVLEILAAIAEGEGLDDLVADLEDLAKLAEAHPATFALDGKLPANVHVAARAAAAALLGRTDSSEVARAAAHRNRCFWLANEAFDEVYAALGFALRGKDEQVSDFFRPYYARNKAAQRSLAAKKARAGRPAPI